MDIDPEKEAEYARKVKSGLDRFAAGGGGTVLFDWDGTIRGNDPEHGIKSYIRRGFIESYNYARDLRLKVGICTLRTFAEVPDLGHLGIVFDEYGTLDAMDAYIKANPSARRVAAKELLKKPYEELEAMAVETFARVAKGERPESWDLLLQAGAEAQASYPDYPNPKLLYIAARYEKGERVFLIDDDKSSGGFAEQFGIGVNVPLPKGYIHDKPNS